MPEECDSRSRRIEELLASRQRVVECLARTMEMHDPEVGRHVGRVASVAALLGERLGLDADRLVLLRAAAPLHDVGKVAIPVGVLQKRGELTPSERKGMESHTLVGHELLAVPDGDSLLTMAATIALTHHERFDGNGYPHGQSGTDIPIEGRIVAVADVFDKLLSDRPYRAAFSLDEAMKTIAAERGAHFDPEVVDALLNNLEEALALRG